MKIAEKVKISDFSSFEAGKGSNGGCYGFATTYSLLNRWELEAGIEKVPVYELWFSTTADFDYCGYCGSWGSCNCGDEPQTCTLDELLVDMQKADSDPSESIYSEIISEIEISPNLIDWVKVRRRIEDRLRKDNDFVVQVAKLGHIKLQE